MAQAVGDVFALGVGVWLNPLAIVFLILILLSPSATVNGIAFSAGWFVAVFALAAVAFVLSEVTDADTTASAQDGIDGMRILVGLGFWLLAYLQIRRRANGASKSPPAFFDRIATLGPKGALISGALLAVANVKAIPLTLSAGASLAGAGLSGSRGLIALAIFAGISSLGILALVVATFALGDRATQPLTKLKDGVLENLTAIVVVILVLLGAVFIGQGLAVLG